jgi:hypothetical protein
MTIITPDMSLLQIIEFSPQTEEIFHQHEFLIR